MSNPAAHPPRRRPGRHRTRPQTWPLSPDRRPSCRRVLAALGYGAGAALIANAIVLLIGAAVTA